MLVFIVDDNLSTVELMNIYFEGLNFKTKVTDYLHAVKTFQENPDSFDFVVVNNDPRVSGLIVDLNAVIRSLRPDLPIVYLTCEFQALDIVEQGIDTSHSMFVNNFMDLMGEACKR